MRTIGYNSQRNNFDFAGKFPGWKQCFSTCAWMFMSYATSKIQAQDDKGLAKYVDDVEATVGKPGLGEKLMQKFRITGPTSFWWAIHQAAITQYLNSFGARGHCIFRDGDLEISSLPDLLQDRPVIIGTRKLGGLPAGHIILIADYDPESESFICNDPYGDAKTDYQSDNGFAVPYEREWLTPYITVTPGKCRCMYWGIDS